MKVRNLVAGEFEAGEELELTHRPGSFTVILNSLREGSDKWLLLIGAIIEIPSSADVEANLIEVEGVKEVNAKGETKRVFLTLETIP